ncbi:MAG TPA: restriction endonuclease subunit S [Tepidisphaeraceae bacterium]|jgi:type I restriction enzyme S subunit
MTMEANIGGLLEGWAEVTIAEVTADVQIGFASGQKDVAGGLAQLRMNNVGEEGQLVLDLIRKVPPSLARPHHLLKPGDSIVCTTNSGKLVGKCALFDLSSTYTFSNHLTRLRPHTHAIDPYFLRWNLWLLWRSGVYEESCRNWVNQSTLPREALIAANFLLPPLAEQKRIVAKVEELLARVNAARQRLAKAVPILKRFRQSVLAAACSGQLTTHWRESNQAEPWVSISLGEVVEIIGGSQPAKDHFVYKPEPGYVRLIQIRDYKSDDHLTFVPRKLARRFCTGTDVMIGRYGPPLFQILRGLEGAYNVALMKAVPRNPRNLLNSFLFVLLQEPKLRQDVIHFSERTVGQDGVRKDLLEAYEVRVPPGNEQHEIVRRVESLFALADKIEARIQAATDRVEKITQAILAKAFRGELVPTEAELARQERREYEPASVLLDRIKNSTELSPPAKAKRSRRATNDETAVVTEPKLSSGAYLKRGTVAAYAINRLHMRLQFERVQLEKLLYLAETHIGLNLEGRPVRQKLGPLDPYIYKLESLAKGKQWFFAKGRKGEATQYLPGQKIREQLEWVPRILGKHQKEFDRLLDKFEKMDTEQAELFATVFAAWNDFLIDGVKPTDEQIIKEVRENWHAAKQRFTPDRLQTCIDWIRKHDFIPRGAGPRTIAAAT